MDKGLKLTEEEKAKFIENVNECLNNNKIVGPKSDLLRISYTVQAILDKKITKSNKELQLEEYYNIPLSKKVPKKIQKEWNFWAKVIIDHEQMLDYYFYNEYVNDQERTEAENAYDEVQQFVKESKLGYRELFKNANKLFPREYDNWGAFKNDVLKHIIAWKFYKIYAGPWVSRNGKYSDVMGIGEENQNSQGNYYL